MLGVLGKLNGLLAEIEGAAGMNTGIRAASDFFFHFRILVSCTAVSVARPIRM